MTKPLRIVQRQCPAEFGITLCRALTYGGGRIRTFEDRSRQIYSLLPLTAWLLHRRSLHPHFSVADEHATGES